MIDASGRVVSSAPAFRPAVLVEEVPPAREGATPYSRAGDWPVAATAIAGLAIAVRRRNVSRSA